MDNLAASLDLLCRSQPEALAAEDETGAWTHRELRDWSLRLASILQAKGAAAALVAPPRAPRPLMLALQRGRAWYALCFAGWRLGLPVAALSVDMPDKAAERDRASRASWELRPIAAVVDGVPTVLIPSLPEDCIVLQVAELTSPAAERLPPALSIPGGYGPGGGHPLLYAYTGGTTKHSKCVVTTHSMALWELAHYAEVAKSCISSADRVLQYTSAYWGAAAFGQLDVALAFGACAVFVPTKPGIDWLAEAVAQHRISVLGTVPSQLRGAFPGGPRTKPESLRVILTWGEKLSPKLSGPWRQSCSVIELLIASEYWLALHSDCQTCRDPCDGQEKHVLVPLRGLDMLLLKDDGQPAAEGEAGELLLTGPTVSTGYIGPDGAIGTGPENEQAFTWVAGRRYFRTKDRLRRMQGGGLVYCGRVDSLAKRGGVFMDVEALEAAVTAVPGVQSAAILVGDETDVFVTLEPPPYQEPLHRILDRVKQASGGACRLHPRSELPYHPATGKLDRRWLRATVEEGKVAELRHLWYLRQVQRRVLNAYVSMWLPSLLLLVVPSLLMQAIGPAVLMLAGWVEPSLLTPLELLLGPFLAESLLAYLDSLVARALFLPYFWAALVYVPVADSDFWKRPMCLQELELLAVAVIPAPFLGAGTALCCAMLLWVRDRGVAALWNRAARSLAMLVLFLACAAVQLLQGREPLSPSLAVCGSVALTVLVLSPPCSRGFFLGLPVTFCVVFPKWFSDEWTWRCNCREAFFRRFLGMLLVYQPRPEWDCSWSWDETRTQAYWSGPFASHNIQVRNAQRGMAMSVSMYENPEPAVRVPEQQPEVGQGSGEVPPALAVLIEKAGGNPQGLGRLDSLQAITLAELIRKEMGLAISVLDILRAPSATQLAAQLAESGKAAAEPSQLRAEAGGAPDAQGAYRVFLMEFPRMPVDWLVRYTGPGHLDIAAVQRAADRLVARHSALRTVQSPDDSIRTVMDKAAAVWQIWCTAHGRRGRLWSWIQSIVGSCMYGCWPRTVLIPTSQALRPLKYPKCTKVRDERWDYAPDDDYVHSTVRDLLFDHRWPFDIAVIPLYKGQPAAAPGATSLDVARTLPPEAVAWYIYFGVTHCFSDGASGQAVFGDLLRLYEEEAGTTAAKAWAEVPEHLNLLQRRLWPSLLGRVESELMDANNDVYHEVACEDFGKRPGKGRTKERAAKRVTVTKARRGFTTRLYFDDTFVRLLRTAASDILGCGVDVTWLTACMGAMFRLFPEQRVIRLMLKTPCRDGPGEVQMIGFLSEQRVLSVDILDSASATLLSVASSIGDTRRARSWRAPVPFESGLCIYVNIVSAMVDGLPQNYRHVVRSATTPSGWSGTAYCHLNLRIDQVSNTEWDFRIFHWDASWGWNWVTCFAHALAGTVRDLVACPTAPLLRPTPVAAPSRWGSSRWGSSRWGSSSWNEPHSMQVEERQKRTIEEAAPEAEASEAQACKWQRTSHGGAARRAEG